MSEILQHYSLSRAQKGKKLKSGLYDKPGNARIVTNEWYAHTAVDDALGLEITLDNLSFNLLVAGELEIVLSQKTGEKERQTK